MCVPLMLILISKKMIKKSYLSYVYMCTKTLMLVLISKKIEKN